MPEHLPAILGEDPVFLDAVERCSRLALVPRPCLVVGERGTGKELFAARLHYLSPRWNQPLGRINCAALTESLLESELFGHEAGAFTGAQRRRAGFFERADGGTLILDEIADASPAVQEKLLRVVEYGEFERVGGSDTLQVDVRVIGSTNVDLPSLAAAGGFRPDLLDRLAFDVITIPPLRARPQDILPLAEAFGLQIARALELDAFPGFSPAALHKLSNHTWPGNVRELRNAVERSVFWALRHGGMIDQLILDPFDSPWRPPSGSRTVGAGVEGSPPRSMPVPKAETGFTAAVAAYERGLLENALNTTRHNQAEAARRLDLSYHQFRRLMKKHGVPSPRSAA
ncbi:MAG: phage shock protein operon transcriptional activator [Alphaproteobacteria bacterium]|jgi:psp operon transcriptional activator|nr:phage shock protein operon transcriptional activator [Alphaproteobacteria bacterium]MDP6563812.1 phage shock protein operon transcriptional activator [Alphaproteobacteria bacterium]MDP6811751.1 phage shock protein operon transcriptional activator [Alphaproteobacteria bacterium]